jgi:hypothetical protein
MRREGLSEWPSAHDVYWVRDPREPLPQGPHRSIVHAFRCPAGRWVCGGCGRCQEGRTARFFAHNGRCWRGALGTYNEAAVCPHCAEGDARGAGEQAERGPRVVHAVVSPAGRWWCGACQRSQDPGTARYVSRDGRDRIESCYDPALCPHCAEGVREQWR